VNYFMRHRENGEVKIGYSGSPIERQHQIELSLQRQSRPGRRVSSEKARQLSRLEMIASVIGDKRQERRIHDLFCGYRVHGEWFRADVLKPAIFWVYEWCETEASGGPGRAEAYGQLWQWMTDGVRWIRLRGEITWRGRRWDGGAIHDDISGAKFSVPRSALEEFADRLLALPRAAG
jgi:hypothetical protein